MYATSGLVQSILTESYTTRGIKKNFIEVIKEIYIQKEYQNTRPMLAQDSLWSNLSDEQFIELLSKLPIPMGNFLEKSSQNEINEIDILPEDSDIFVFKEFNFLSNTLHCHNYFEICYVFRGHCTLYFEKEQRTLNEGELCILAPMSSHNITVEDEKSVILIINIRKSTFERAFFSLLTHKDLLSYFFKTILYNQTSPNYLLFTTAGTSDILLAIKNLVMENYREDIYQNNCCISWTNILFSTILRNYKSTIQYSHSHTGKDFTSILDYIQSHYRHLTLKSLAEVFHYSEAHLSVIIKQNTGLNFKTIVTQLKMTCSLDYIKNTDLSVEEIAEQVGYHSVDHFSRTFKKFHSMSPQQYRKAYRSPVKSESVF